MSGNRELVLESELLGSRGHPIGGEEWTFVERNVANLRVVNNQEPKVMGMYDGEYGRYGATIFGGAVGEFWRLCG